MKKYVSGLLVGLLACVSLPALAGNISTSGYASFATTYSNARNSAGPVAYYFGLASNENQFDTSDNNIGLQFNAKASKQVDMTLVLHVQGGTSNYSIGTEWAYATYHVNNDLQLRIGKYKGPFYMISDYQNVGYAYPWVRPPLEVYSTNPIKALSGLDMLWQKNIGNSRFLFELYAGEGTHQTQVMAEVANSSMGTANNLSVGQVIPFETPKSLGFNMSISGDIGSFRLGYYRTKVNVDKFGMENQLGTFGGAGFTIDKDNVVMYGEYVVRNTQNSQLMQAAFPDQIAYYLTAGYRFGKYLPYLTYAHIGEGSYKSDASEVQSSIALGLRAEVGDASDVKFEAMRVTPHANSAGYTYGLFNAQGVKNAYVLTATFDTTF